ncbi:MAG: SDR family oxidoreductase [Bacteroidota bacterium]
MIYQDKIAVVTGSTSGLGEAVAKKLAAEGAGGIIVTGRNPERGERVSAELTEMGCKNVFVQADLALADSPQKIFAAVDQHFGGHIHGLVNSAAYTDRGSIEATPLEEFNKHMHVNVRAPFFLIQEAVKRMQQHKIAGSIVNIGSVSAHVGQEFLTAYSTSKGALTTLTKNVAHSQKHHRIRCNGILPGWMDTPAEHDIQKRFHDPSPDWLEKAEATRPFGQLIKPWELAELVAFLLSEKAGIMNGAVMNYDQLVIGTYD